MDHRDQLSLMSDSTRVRHYFSLPIFFSVVHETFPPPPSPIIPVPQFSLFLVILGINFMIIYVFIRYMNAYQLEIQKQEPFEEDEKNCLVDLKTFKAEKFSWICYNDPRLPRQDIKFEILEEKSKRKWRSGLGNYLFSKNSSLPSKQQKNQTFLILIWKFGKKLSHRFLYGYQTEYRNPFNECSVQNCEFTYDSDQTLDADAVMFHLQLLKGPHELPTVRSSNQRWVFFTDESPHHTFMKYRQDRIKDFNGYFNWSMTYRRDSDVPVPYGRTVESRGLNKNRLSFHHGSKSKFAAILRSNCGGPSKRTDMINQIQSYIDIDFWGSCAPKNKTNFKCPGGFRKDCPGINDYRFYLAFENSACHEYITEKFWWNAFHKGAVPVVLGGLSSRDYEEIAPPGSFIHVGDFGGDNSLNNLANFLTYLNERPHLYNKFHLWRTNYTALNEHGYFGAPVKHYCRLCEALNYNDPSPKTYSDLTSFWSISEDCLS